DLKFEIHRWAPTATCASGNSDYSLSLSEKPGLERDRAFLRALSLKLVISKMVYDVRGENVDMERGLNS
ncbi:MAG TPA: hypothetical protein VG326_10420, partial [Tepidisphaeraceae bacterium]|nr:hypothetical protein [Tepidisphaeraceae bacterium]